ncbi:hypothetical protein ABKN59_007175 [Abortiporus biennis]
MLSYRPQEHVGDYNVAPSSNNVGSESPAKPLLKTPGRALLGNRGALQENAAHFGSGAMTVNRKGKGMQVHTPFHPATVQAKKALQATIKPSVVISRPLGDKTPFPNRQQLPLHTPAPQTTKIAKLSLLEPNVDFTQTPGALLLPSSARRSSRAPRTSGSGRALTFKTPLTNGNHWDVSDGELEVDEAELELSDVQSEDSDEIEYMPPKVSEQPYEPDFSMPDHKELGKRLLSIHRSYHFDDTADLRFSQDIDQSFNVAEFLSESQHWESVSLPDCDDDDPFKRPMKPVTKKSDASSTLVPPRPKSATQTNPTARISKTAGPSTTRIDQSTKATIRPATSVGIRPPASRALPSARSHESKPINSLSNPGRSRPATSVPPKTVTTKPITKSTMIPTASRARATSVAVTHPSKPSVAIGLNRAKSTTRPVTHSRTVSKDIRRDGQQNGILSFDTDVVDDFLFDV